jgi:peptidyl-prolyl cis-trans isomerase B (cyclophilin B)
MAPIHSQVGSSLSKQTANAPKIAHSSRPLPARRRRQAAAVTASAAPQQQNPTPTTRRALIIESAAASAAALLAAATPALAEDAVEAVPAAAPAAAAAGGAQRAYLDVRLEGQPLGRLTVELLPDAAPVGARRFADLAVGRQGVGYRLARCGVLGVCFFVLVFCVPP